MQPSFFYANEPLTGFSVLRWLTTFPTCLTDSLANFAI